jgi:eukaryotic-like serine/threonine-protein kinase
MALTPGTRLDGYEIVGPLGAGGMGEVYRARDSKLRRDVAIKVLPEYWSRDPERLRRFEQEAQATAALNHPNIVSIFHVGQYDGSPYIVTELLQGETLRERLRHGRMRLRETIDIGGDIARGLAAAHDAGITHRDLKPDNIFLTKDARVKILDFGLAKLQPSKDASADGPTASYQPQTSPGHVLGTVGYMSPEQVRGAPADARSDIFAAGAVLYEMLTGKPAFRKATSAETMTAILNEDPPAVSQLTPSVPPGLQRIVNRCLSKNPDQRIQHATDFAFALEELSDSGSTGTTTVKEQRPARRWIWVVAGIAAIALAVAMFVWWKVPPAVPVVEAVIQLTDDGQLKEQSNPVTDGSRIYFNVGSPGSLTIAQVSVIGGLTAPVDTRLVNPYIVGLAPDGSALLAAVGSFLPAYPLWSIPLPAGEPRRLGNIEAEDAAFFPDGRILFQKGTDLYVAGKDASNPRKLVAVGNNFGHPSISPDGKRIVVPVYTPGRADSLVEIAADGGGPRTILNANQDEKFGPSVGWSLDGKYLVYRIQHRGASDLWSLPVQTGIFHRLREPIRLTNGPLSYSDACPSRDGKQIFAIGVKRRGEVVRYDLQSHQFVPFLSGISARDPNFSKDGQWVAYTSYPDHTLWRSRSDGTERMQLTYPPMEVAYPFISPDGTKVAFRAFGDEIFVVGMDGGVPQKIIEGNSSVATWSPDGNLLVMTSWSDATPGEQNTTYLRTFDLRTGKLSVVPSSQGKCCAQWIDQDTIVAANEDSTKFLTFDFKTQKWTDLLAGSFVNWNLSPDRKYFYFATPGSDPMLQRLRLADHHLESITSLKGLRRVSDWVENTQFNVAPDGSPIFTRDIGSQEIYALSVRWP